ncbi:MAG TPA: GYF domain-containing protein [Kofleriaceae bacterium]
MKFLCDRCKTRYSIGDDRVRGKILKIRCKNCANVITVREGMPDADSVEANGARQRGKSTTQAPAIQSDAPAANGALGAAFASAMTKPPPALEEEWYVSIDGDQSGPFSLAEAQRWVANKPFDAELHCWSEGFDDWLPVDKVSHFRGLRKKPLPPAAPPPLPRVGGGARPHMVAAASAPVEEEPKPLFAATMASLEKSSGTSSSAGLNLPPITGSARPSATPPKGQPSMPSLQAQHAQQAKTNGAPRPSLPQPTSRKTPIPSLSGRATPVPKFDTTESALDSATQIEQPPFEDESRTTAEPVASARREARPPSVETHNDKFLNAMAASAAAAPMPEAKSEVEDDEPDGLDIGEVSRVVKLADLARTPRTPANRRSGPVPNLATNAAVGRASGSVSRLAGSAPSIPVNPLAPIGPDGQVASQVLDPSALTDAAHGDPASDLAAHAPPAVSHRRGMIALLVGAAGLLGISILVVVLVVNKDQITNNSLGGDYSFDPSRPDDMRPNTGTTAGSNKAEPPSNPFVPKKRPQQPQTPYIPPTPTGNSLKAEEIEQMAAKYSSTTQRCYMSSMKGVDLINIGDVKKITVTLGVNPDGSVTNVTLSDKHETNKLGRCLINTITRWKFRTSPGGTFRFVIHFG